MFSYATADASFFSSSHETNMEKFNFIKSQLVQFTQKNYSTKIVCIDDVGRANINHILIHPSVLKEADSVIAGVLAHEWGHKIMGHDKFAGVPLPSYETSRLEGCADQFAAEFMALHNYPIEPLLEFNLRYRPKIGNEGIQKAYYRQLEEINKQLQP